MILEPNLAQRQPRFSSLVSTGSSDAASVKYAEQDGWDELLMGVGVWVLIWVALFYILSISYPQWGRQVGSSTKPHENDRYWCARNVLGIVHALFISAISLPALWLLLFQADSTVQLATTTHLGHCKVDERDTELLPWETTLQAVAVAGLAFTTFTLADIFISLAHGLATADYIVHHIAFVIAGVIIRGNCMLPLNAAILMAMEVSTPFLNWLMFFRHRGEHYKLQVMVAGSSFFATFLLFRVVLNTYGTVLLLHDQAQGLAVPAKVPAWQSNFLVVAVTAGALVQMWWLPGICRQFGSKLMALISCGTCDISEDEASPTAKPACADDPKQQTML
eukprot:gb/GFBE01010505.1/.p1 GENE.gb/GFBE01010505.1/~~gb/GFBE01010505.1/.p1  ORF type:complete len:335 (+),score=68.22 gb/GFBE01010505.1/:1-1005(+)